MIPFFRNLILLFPVFIQAYWANDFYREDMNEHKKIFSEKLELSPHPYSQWRGVFDRVLLGVNCNDSDFIPKVPDAGKVFDGTPEPYQVMHNGIKILQDCYYGSWMTDLIFGLKGHHEPQEEKIFFEVLKFIPKNAVMIEIGSFWGYYSLWFAKDIQGAKNFLIEPDPRRVEIGKKHFQLNNTTGCFFRGYIYTKDLENDADYNGAEPIIIDTFLKQNGIDHVHILHADIQGAEYDMLLSCVNSIQQKKIDYFFISTHGPHLHQPCIDFLVSHGYHIIAEHSMLESYSFDGLIVARRKDVKGPDSVAISKRKL